MAKSFDELAAGCMGALERMVRYRVSNAEDARDVLQEALISAYERFGTLASEENFRAWLMAIAANRVRDYYRAKARRAVDLKQLYLETRLSGDALAREAVRDTLAELGGEDGCLLRRRYLEGYGAGELARLSGVAEGTMAGRLMRARERFARLYPYAKEGTYMEFPTKLSKVIATRLAGKPFEVICEQDTGIFLAPRIGEKRRFAFYDFDDNGEFYKSGETRTEAVGAAEVHGIECVRILEIEQNADGEYRTTLFERLHAGRLQTLAALQEGQGDKYAFITFLDEKFARDWAFGADNGGEETIRKPRGIISEAADGALRVDTAERRVSDVCGLYSLEICGKVSEAIRYIYFDGEGVLVELYIGRDGRALLSRRFNCDRWREGRPDYQKWSERFPTADRLTVNGETYVNWYNCLPDYAVN